MATGMRKTGEFCWINMLTPEPAEARAFFGKLLGWTYFEMPGMGHRVQVGGRDIGGLFDLDGPNTPQGTPPSIGVMVKVENADAVCEKVTALGGKAQAGVRHHGSGPDGRLLRSQRRRVRRLGAEEGPRHRRRQQPTTAPRAGSSR